MKICAHTLVKNEARYLWYAAQSVLPYVDKMLLWDTGSTDNTPKVINEIKKSAPDKVEVKLLKSVSIVEFTDMRNKMLQKTDEDWILIVDGDEVWWDEGIRMTTDEMRNGKNLETIINTYENVIGDIYHYQDESAHHYKIDDHVGALNVRAIRRNIPGLHVSKPHGSQGYYDNKETLIQEREKSKRIFINTKAYLHFTHMNRAGTFSDENNVPKRKQKFKHELGIPFPSDFFYPEVFFRPRPEIVPSVWVKRNLSYELKSSLLKYPKYIHRKYFKIPEAY